MLDMIEFRSSNSTKDNMRIISGRLRGKKLSPFTGIDIRPTPDKVRGAIFSILFSRLGSFDGLRVLDLFAGTGAMSLEALSRGSSSALLVDNGTAAAKTISANIALCNVSDQAILKHGDVLKSLQLLRVDEPFDLIFLDPPYNKELAEKTICLISQARLLSPSGVVCAETDKKETMPETQGTLHRIETRIYGSTAVHFYCHAGEPMQ